MKQWTIKEGDTLENLSRRFFGTEARAADISYANPGVDHLTPGITINIPDAVPDNAVDPVALAVDPDEVSLSIDNQVFKYWESVKLGRKIDSFSTCDFSTPFQLDNKAFREMFRPFQYLPLTVNIGNERFFTGTLVDVSVPPDTEKVVVNGNAYALPAVLSDCNFPSSLFPVEFDSSRLSDIVKATLRPFGFKAIFSASDGAVFDRVACDPNKKCFDFYSELAKQRNLLISNDAAGNLIFWKPVKPGKPVSRLVEGTPPVISISSTFNSQEYYSHVTGVQENSLGIDGEVYTVRNSRLAKILRPYTFEHKDITGPSIEEATRAKAGRMFGGAVSYTAEVMGWRDSNGALWRENTTVTVLAPKRMIYNEYEFLIKGVTFTRADKEKRAVLDLALPEAFTGTIPERMPWE